MHAMNGWKKAGSALGILIVVLGYGWLLWKGPWLFDGSHIRKAGLQPADGVVITGFRTMLVAVGAIAAFGGVGLLHDLGVYAFRLQRGWTDAPSLRLTLLFLIFALVVVAWREIARRGGRLVKALTPRARWALDIVSRLALANVVFALAALAIPVLRTGRFPPLVEAILRWMS